MGTLEKAVSEVGMDRYRAGMLAKSKAGHDAGRIYVITDTDGAYVYLADGRLRTVGRPKKKKARHVQLICEEHDVSAADDVQIKRILKEYISKEEEI
jgi:ribosomal protein L14E/L6E/L27E